VGHVRVGFVDQEVLGEDAVLDVGVLPAAERAAGLGGVARLRGEGAPIGGDGADGDPVTRLESRTSSPTFSTIPTASCPSVRFVRSPIAPWTVWTSDVQIRALVGRTSASSGPGSGTGLSTNPAEPICFMTNAFMLLPLSVVRLPPRFAHRPYG